MLVVLLEFLQSARRLLRLLCLLCLCWVFVATLRFSLVAAMEAALRCGVWASRGSGFSCCRAQAQWLRPGGFAAPQHVLSSRGRDQSCVPALAGRCFSTEPPGKSLEHLQYAEAFHGLLDYGIFNLYNSLVIIPILLMERLGLCRGR